MSRLDALRARNLTSHQLMLLAAQTGDPLIAAEADARAVVERVRKGPVRPGPDAPITATQAARMLTAAFAGGKSRGGRLL